MTCAVAGLSWVRRKALRGIRSCRGAGGSCCCDAKGITAQDPLRGEGELELNIVERYHTSPKCASMMTPTTCNKKMIAAPAPQIRHLPQARQGTSFYNTNDENGGEADLEPVHLQLRRKKRKCLLHVKTSVRGAPQVHPWNAKQEIQERHSPNASKNQTV